VLGATVDRSAIVRGVRLLNRVGVRPGGVVAADFADAFSAPEEITHEVDVRRWVGLKQRALRAHASQLGGGSDVRTAALLGRLPRPLARRVLGREWFVELGAAPGAARVTDVFASCRSGIVA
jgi:LmbE family N-acetylglucosaminyl deacetylase